MGIHLMLEQAHELVKQKTRDMVDANAAITGQTDGFIYRGQKWMRREDLYPGQLKRLAWELQAKADEVIELQLEIKRTEEFATNVYSTLFRLVQSYQDVRNVFPDWIRWGEDTSIHGLERTEPLPYVGIDVSLNKRLYDDCHRRINYCNSLVLLMGVD